MRIIDVPLDKNGIPQIPCEIKKSVRMGEQIHIRITNVGTGFVRNALKWGVAGLNVDAGRIGIGDEDLSRCLLSTCSPKNLHAGWDRPWRRREDAEAVYKTRVEEGYARLVNKGRFPANVLFSHSPDCTDEVCVEGCPIRILDEQSGIRTPGKHPAFRSPHNGAVFTKGRKFSGQSDLSGRAANSGGASRFFYCSKATSSERGYGNNHPTVKPVALMKYLVGLLKMPEPGIILDPFAGSGTTLLACHETGIPFLGIEREEEYVEIARRRIAESTPSIFMADKVESLKTNDKPADGASVQVSLFD